MPPAASTASMNRSPCSYCLSLASSPMSRWSSLAGADVAAGAAGAAPRRTARPSGCASPPARSMVTSPWPSSRLISPPIRSSDVALLGRGEQGHDAAVGERVLRRCGSPRPAGRARRGTASGRGRPAPSMLFDQAQEVLAQPRHAGELRAVGDLVERQPQAELAGREGEALLQGEDVGPDVVHDVLVVGLLVLDDEQVVLAEHPGRHPAEQHADSAPADARRRPARAAAAPCCSSSLSVSGPQQALERGDVGLDPAGAVGDPGPGRAGQRRAARWLADQLLGLRGQLGEVGRERVVVVRRRRRARVPATRIGHLLGERPSRRRPPWSTRSCGVRGSWTTLMRYPTIVATTAQDRRPRPEGTAIQKCQTWAASRAAAKDR